MIGRRVSEKFRQPNGLSTQNRNRVPDEDAGDVEEEVAEGDLESGVDLARVGGERGQKTGDGGADVSAERQWVHALDADDPDADERRQRRREDGAALNEERHSGAHHHRDVAGGDGSPTGEVGVNGSADNAFQRAAKH